MKKRIFAACLVIMVGLMMVAGGTLAYFTDEDTAHNVITSGGISIDLIEQTKDDSGTLVDFPEEGISGVMPGMAVSKIVKVQNTGSGEAWIRVKVDESMVDASGQTMPMTFGEEETPVMTYVVLSGWIDGGDGYYYYEQPVAPGAFTDVLFEEVKFDSAMGNEYQDCTANLIVSAQAVQTANNGASVTEAQGWPAEIAE